MSSSNWVLQKSFEERTTIFSTHLPSTIERWLVARYRSLLILPFIVAFASWSVTSSAAPTIVTSSGDSLKARLSNLIEVMPNSFSTNIDLYGAGFRDYQPFYMKGEILSLINSRFNWYNSTNYLVLAGPSHLLLQLQNNEFDGIPSPGGTNESFEQLVQTADNETISRGAFQFRFISTRFFKGALDGNTSTLILLAQKWFDPGVSLGINPSDTVKVMISLYELQADGVDLPGHFVRMVHFVTSQSYCNTDLALWRELAIPLPPIYAGKQITCQR